MKCVHDVRITRRMDTTLERFMAENFLLRRKAMESGLSVIDFVIGSFLPVRKADEMYRDWLIRQIGEVLEIELMHDEASDKPAGSHAHLQQRIRSVEITEADYEYLMDTFGNNPDVLECWSAIPVMSEKIREAA